MSYKRVILRLIYSFCLVSFLASFTISCKQVKLSEADRLFNIGEYYEASTLYRKIYRKTPPKNREQRGHVAFRLAESYRQINFTANANPAYTNAIRYNPTDTLIRLQYARTLHKSGNYKQAAEQYKLFLKVYPENQFALNGLKGTEIAPQLKDNPTLYTVKRMDLFNSRRGEFAPKLLPPDYDMIYFATNRDDVLGDEKSTITGVSNNDIFVARKDENSKWMKPESAGGVNTEFDEGAVSFSISGDVMYYTFCGQNPEKPTTARIYKSLRSGGEWGKGTPLESQDSTVMMAHPAISPSGEFLYFVSDMKGSYGGKDIWRASMIGDEINYIENLGPEINTAGDEMFPYVRNDSTLYYSSDGLPGMGGLDIFKATYKSKEKKWIVENMGYPINSSGDDLGITFVGNTENGFFSSNRNEPKGVDHIYSFEYPTMDAMLEGYIVDKDDEFVPNATIRIVGNNGTNAKFEGKPNGTYSMEVDKDVSYVLLASAEGYLNAKKDLRTVNVNRDSTYFVDFVLYSINKPAVLENIFYDFDKAALRDESKKELDDLIELLEINPHVTIELSAHTDRKGTQEYNQRLSQRRAQSVVDYLIDHRIAKDRLTVAGYGKLQPKTVTKGIAKKNDFLKEGDILTEEFILALPPEQQEMADQINRRTEFKVLSITYGLENK